MYVSEDKDKIRILKNLLIFVTFISIIKTLINVPSSIDLNSIIFIIINLLVLSILLYVSKISSKYGKRAFIGWILITSSLLVTILGNIIWIVLPIGFNQPSSPSIADIFYLAYYPLIIMGILHLPVTQTHEIKKYHILIDTGILIVSFALVLWVILINPLLHMENPFSIVISLSYLFLDIFLLFTLFYLFFNWFGQVKKTPLLLLIMSALILVITNLIFLYQFLYGIYNSGGLLDAGWSTSYILTALAGIYYINDEKIRYISSFPYKLSPKINLSSYLPLLWLFFIYLLSFWIYLYPEGSDANVLLGGAVIIITLVFIRQIIALEDSNRTQKLLQDNQNILEKREKHLSLITNNMMDLITQSDTNGVYQYLSPSSKKILGYDSKSLLGKNVLDFVHPDDLETFKSFFKNAKYYTYPNEIEYRFKKDTETYVWLETVGTPIFNHENEHMGFVCGTRDIDYRKHAEEQIKASLEEKKVLLKEIHHRVKNNMQVISSLLSLQSRYIKDDNYRDIFKESQDRVRSMAMIHENLYRSENLARINIEKYIQKLVSGLFNSYGIKSGLIISKINVESVMLDIDSAIPCGLILNELVTNSLKHAFPANVVRKFEDKNQGNEVFPDSKNKDFEGSSIPVNIVHGQTDLKFNSPEDYGEISIEMLQEGNSLKMIVGDNGIGFPENIDFKNTESLGLQLVNTLVKQLNGSIELENGNGTKFIIKFEKTGK